MSTNGVVPAGLQKFFELALWRIRRERMWTALGALVKLLLIVVIGWTALILWKPELALGVPWGLGVAAVLLIITLDVALFWQVEPRQVWLRLDRELGLKDAVISCTELGAEAADVWRSRQLAATLAALQARPMSQAWASRPSRLTPLASLLLVFFSGVLLLNYFAVESEARPVSSPFLEAQLSGVEQVFKDWDEAQKNFEDPVLKRLLEELKPLREKMASGQMREKDAMLALSRVEEKLEAARKNLEAKSLEAAAGEMAGALEPLENMSSLSAALRRKDFAQAEKLAAQQAEALAQADAKAPQGAQEQANQQRMGNLAKNLQERGQQGASEAMQKMGDGMKKNDPKQMGQGMQGLKQTLGDQAKRSEEKKRLSTQLAQMGQCKECLGNGQSMARGMSLMPKLALMKKPGGKGAGSEIDLNRFGAETQLASNRTEEKVTGTLDGGDSETTTEKSNETQRETTSGPRAARFQQYEKLSREAIEDENIPLAHRQTIRKYFELIRPEGK